METVGDLLSDISREVWSIQPETTVYEAINMMAEKDFGAVAVLDENSLIGIFTERDYARKLLLEGRSSMLTKVKATMSPEVIFVRPDQSLEECLAIMVDNKIRHLPVLDSKKLVGLISIADLAKAAIQAKVPGAG